MLARSDVGKITGLLVADSFGGAHSFAHSFALLIQKDAAVSHKLPFYSIYIQYICVRITFSVLWEYMSRIWDCRASRRLIPTSSCPYALIILPVCVCVRVRVCVHARTRIFCQMLSYIYTCVYNKNIIHEKSIMCVYLRVCMRVCVCRPCVYTHTCKQTKKQIHACMY
jgi:hypothetical protein